MSEKKDSFETKKTINVGSDKVSIWHIPSLEKSGFKVSTLPFAHRILLENLLRQEDGNSVTGEDIEAVLNWDPNAQPSNEIAFTPARVLLQDFTGVPAVVDLAAMREAVEKLGGDAARINPLQPAELVIDHSVQVDQFGSEKAFRFNAEMEFERNRERYKFLKWGQSAFENFKVVPPSTGIVHQVNLEFLGRVVISDGKMAYPDTLVGTDSHTTMINGLGILGWGVGGIEAEAAMLGQPISMLLPQVVGFRLTGKLPEGATATDLVLMVTEILRKKGVVGKFVEYFGDGLENLTLADRATIANMAPEYGATCGIFPVDDLTLEYLRLTGRNEKQVKLIETYMKEQGMFRVKGQKEARYSDVVELDLSKVEASLAGPKRPQDRVRLGEMKKAFQRSMDQEFNVKGSDSAAAIPVKDPEGSEYELRNGSTVIAAITSCTNTSNPSVMIGAGLLAKKAVEKGLNVAPWVKTSFAPGSQVVSDYLKDAGLMEPLEKLRFHLVGYGCTTCIGNSGPLPDHIVEAIEKGRLVASAVLSGNRNFEGRISPHVRANYLASPPLVVAFALAGRADIDFESEAVGKDKKGNEVYLKDIWPTNKEILETIMKTVSSEGFQKRYANVYAGDKEWQAVEVPKGKTYAWEKTSTYIKHPPYFEGMKKVPEPVTEIEKARVLALLGDSVTTDHISPAGSISKNSPAAVYLENNGVKPAEFNSYGSRRGNHEVMMRGTFANVRLRNLLVPGTEGGMTKHLPDGAPMTIFDAAMRYKEEKTPLIVIAGKEYGTGSSRDWAAKGPALLGVKAVIAESYERIHRSNLIGMGILPLQFKEGDSADSLKLTGEEEYRIDGIVQGAKEGFKKTKTVKVMASCGNEKEIKFEALVRIDTPNELEYYKHGGILHYVLRQLI